jgi:hypothetical protein
MAKWEDKHMYDWLGWMRSLINVRERINDWTVSPKKAYKFPIFMANNVILAPILFFIVGLMTMMKTVEWSMALLMGWVNKEMDRDALDGLKAFPVLMVTLFILIPYAVTWGLPKLIQEVRQGRVERRLEEQAETLRQVEEDRRRWEHLDGLEQTREDLGRYLRATRDRGVKAKDFKPKYYVAPHIFNREHKTLFVSPGVYTRDEFVIERNRVGNTSTARVARRNRRYNINIDNE